MAKNQDIVKGIQKYFLIGVLLLLIYTLYKFASPFLGTLFIAAIIVTGAYPLKKRIEKRLKIPKTLLAALLTLTIVLLVIVPFTLFFFSVVGQASSAYTSITGEVNRMIADSDYLSILDKFPTIQAWVGDLIKYNPVSAKDVITTVSDFVGIISSFLLENTTNILKHLTMIVIHVVVFLISLFYFLRDGEPIVHNVQSLLPLSEKYRKELFHKIYQLMHSIIFGIFGAAIAQGLLLGIGLAIAGSHNAVFWGAIGALLSPIPYIGIGVVWIPYAITLFASSHIAMGIFFVLWCLILVANIDNLVKPYLIGSQAALHPFAVLIMMLGGAVAFGFKGLLFGPFILTITLAFLHIYQLEYKRVLQPVNKETPSKLKDLTLKKLREKITSW